MLDALAPGAAVFEPEEVDVLTAACDLALRKVHGHHPADADAKVAVARLVHNLGRSRLRHRKALKDASDAATLAEEAADLFGYLRDAPQVGTYEAGAGVTVARAVPIFPADLRAPPNTILRPRPSDAASEQRA